jgi:hypothetical protein
MTPTSSRVLSTAKARRSSALESALGSITAFLASVPGVRPPVHLLIQLRSEGRARLARELFARLARTHAPASLSDGFYLRLGVTMGGRQPPEWSATELPKVEAYLRAS